MSSQSLPLDKLIPTLPDSLQIVIIVLAVFVNLSPRIIDIIKGLRGYHAQYERRKNRLELLRLKSEIEAIRKKAGLRGLGKQLAIEPFDEESGIDLAGLVFTGNLRLWKRIMIGGVSSIAPVLTAMALLYGSDACIKSGAITDYLAFYVPYLLTFCLLGGLACAFMPKNRSTPLSCALVGAAVGAVLQLLLPSAMKFWLTLPMNP
jgi:hypothetical protein